MAKVVNGYTFINFAKWTEDDWRNQSSSKSAVAMKGGKKYFLKRYTNPVAPINNGSLTPKAMEKNQRRFDKFYDIRSSINREIRKFTSSGGDIIIPCDEFKDENAYVEASEFIENMVPDDDVVDVLKTLPEATKMNLLRTALGALKTVHAHNIVHSDLKLKNILLVKSASGSSYSAKLIDFDNSYFVGKLPDDLVGDFNYYSPELGKVNTLDDCDDDYEEQRAALGAKLTTKSDIFSMGLIFHQYLTGEFVTYKDLAPREKALQDAGRVIYPWQVKLNGGHIVKSPRLSDPFLRKLVGQMTNLDPNQRPVASQVYMALVTKKLPPFGDDDEEDAPPVSTDPAVTGVSISPSSLSLDVTSRPNGNVSATVNAVNGAPTTVTWSSSNPSVATVSPTGQVTALAAGSATIIAVSTFDATKKATCAVNVTKTRVAGFCEPWPEHDIVWDEALLRSRGFIGAEQETQGGVKGYALFTANPAQPARFFKVEILISFKYAKKKVGGGGGGGAGPTPPADPVDPIDGFCEPFPEHGIVWDEERIRSKNWVAVGRDEATKEYIFVSSNGSRHKLNVNTCVALKFAKRV